MSEGNPQYCRYAGRVELPDNLKTLFRPVAMMVPDSTLIAEVLLFTRGFTTAPSLALKLTQLCQTATAQLSRQVLSTRLVPRLHRGQGYCIACRGSCTVRLILMYAMVSCPNAMQVHYDFGLRAIKSTVILAGDYLQSKKQYVFSTPVLLVSHHCVCICLLIPVEMVVGMLTKHIWSSRSCYRL